jgi:hypothetical protein
MTIQPILVMMSYRGGARLQRCLESIAAAEHHFKRIILSITAAEDSDDMRIATEFQQQHPKAEVICTKGELPTMAHQAFWIHYLEQTGAAKSDWIYWLAYDDQVRTRGIDNLVDQHGNWALTPGTAYFGPWAMRHEQADQLWSGDPKAELESWTSFPIEGPTELPVAKWIGNQLVQPTYMQMSGSVIALESHQRVVNGRPKKKGPMRIEMATAATLNNSTVEEFAEPISIIYGRPNSDRASYGNAARSEDVHLVAWLARYVGHKPSSLPAIVNAATKIIASNARLLTKKGKPPAEQWTKRSSFAP